MMRITALNRIVLISLVMLMTPISGKAQEVAECDWRASARAIAEPWETNTRLFANGAVRLALLDTVEPASAAFHLLILSPPYDELGDRQCRVVGFAEGVGYAAMHFQALEAGYDPAIGLIFTLPAQIYLPDSGFSNSTLLTITLNQSTGVVGVTQELGNE